MCAALYFSPTWKYSRGTLSVWKFIFSASVPQIIVVVFFVVCCYYCAWWAQEQYRFRVSSDVFFYPVPVRICAPFKTSSHCVQPARGSFLNGLHNVLARAISDNNVIQLINIVPRASAREDAIIKGPSRTVFIPLQSLLLALPPRAICTSLHSSSVKRPTRGNKLHSGVSIR